MEENSLALKIKKDAMEKKRAGKTILLDVTKSKDRTMNFQHAITEVQKLMSLHSLTASEVHALASQLQWGAHSLNTRTSVTNLSNQILDVMEKDKKELGEKKHGRD